MWMEHSSLVVHNPHAPNRISSEIWQDAPQFIEMGRGMGWSDGKPMMG